MFRRATPTSPYDDLVQEATAENLTEIPWGEFLTVWEKVNEENETGARQCIVALQKRLQHRSANVQLHALALAEALVKNCGKPLHREISSKAFTEALKRLEFDRNTHDKVKVRVACLVRDWTEAFQEDESLGIMSETFDFMKSKGVSFDDDDQNDGHEPTDEERRREEEDIAKAIEASQRETNARQSFAAYMPRRDSYQNTYQRQREQQQQQPVQKQPPPLKPKPQREPQQHQQLNNPYEQKALPADPIPTTPSASASGAQPPSTANSNDTSSRSGLPKKVRALYDFAPEVDGELQLRKGDVVSVISLPFEEWYRGEIGGRVGIFPVRYVEVVPEPSKDDLIREMEAEAAVFDKAADISRLLDMINEIDRNNGSLTDNDELEELYKSCLGFRPRIIELLDKYQEKAKELTDMHHKFTEAKNTYEAKMGSRFPTAHAGQYHQQQQQGGQTPYQYNYNYQQQQQYPPHTGVPYSQPPQQSPYYDYSQYYAQQQAQQQSQPQPQAQPQPQQQQVYQQYYDHNQAVDGPQPNYTPQGQTSQPYRQYSTDSIHPSSIQPGQPLPLPGAPVSSQPPDSTSYPQAPTEQLSQMQISSDQQSYPPIQQQQSQPPQQQQSQPDQYYQQQQQQPQQQSAPAYSQQQPAYPVYDASAVSAPPHQPPVVPMLQSQPSIQNLQNQQPQHQAPATLPYSQQQPDPYGQQVNQQQQPQQQQQQQQAQAQVPAQVPTQSPPVQSQSPPIPTPQQQGQPLPSVQPMVQSEQQQPQQQPQYSVPDAQQIQDPTPVSAPSHATYDPHHQQQAQSPPQDAYNQQQQQLSPQPQPQSQPQTQPQPPVQQPQQQQSSTASPPPTQEPYNQQPYAPSIQPYPSLWPTSNPSVPPQPSQ